MTPASVMKRLKADGASLTSDFHRASLERISVTAAQGALFLAAVYF